MGWIENPRENLREGRVDALIRAIRRLATEELYLHPGL